MAGPTLRDARRNGREDRRNRSVEPCSHRAREPGASLEFKRTTKTERRGESDDEVRGNIPPEFVSLFERVKSRVIGSRG
jgi:hypothetical protein